MRIWIDDVRTAPAGYVWMKSVNQVKRYIEQNEFHPFEYFSFIELIDIDHDAGDYAYDGGDYIKLLNWFEETDRNYPIRIHSMNPVGRENMRAIIRRNGWKEIY